MSGSDRRVVLRRAAIVSLLVALTGAVLGLAFAGSTTHLAAGIRIAGVDVGGMTPRAATARLEARWEELDHVPIRFTIGDQSWRLSASQLGVRPNWRAAVDSVRRQGGGFAPLRGFRRLDLRFFGTDVAPPTQVYDTALTYVLDKVSREVDSKHREASLALRGLQPVVVPGRAGRVVDRSAAAATLVRALASLERQPVELPVRIDTPRVKANDLTVVAAEVKTALSAPVRLTLAGTKFTIRPRRIATLLELPDNGRRDLRIGGRGADAWFGKLAQHVDHPPVDATWAITSHGIHVVPDRPGYSLDVPKSANVLLHAVLVTDPSLRQGALVAQTTHAERTTREAQALQIRGLVSSYETFYGGDPNRVHNVQLVAHLVDGHVIAPGTTFSFNDATGARTADKGFRVAPVIINGELKTGLGGGVCQVSTTVFNAAYEAGLPITSRTNHALYISHYPQGRDATVNYPDTDLKFVNDTGHWLLLRTWVGSSSLTVALYGTPLHRRVVSDTRPLVETAAAPVTQTVDPSLAAGARVVDDSGEPARSTSVRRRVFDARGKLLYDTVFYSSYRAEPEVVRVGPKPPPVKPKPKPTPKPATTTTTTGKTQTTPTTTQP
ncbi:MAG: VanW family protein [Gaiellaceae bacterium]|jgi:vancomycin resistance protein YoaR